mmetsp:Transcript_9410/g.31123  ORF Transcript_9410/g.31123 Transcript_9410/m.31123 type:complete len:213 (-) Transcript_9410:706-1344(-)
MHALRLAARPHVPHALAPRLLPRRDKGLAGHHRRRFFIRPRPRLAGLRRGVDALRLPRRFDIGARDHPVWRAAVHARQQPRHALLRAGPPRHRLRDARRDARVRRGERTKGAAHRLPRPPHCHAVRGLHDDAVHGVAHQQGRRAAGPVRPAVARRLRPDVCVVRCGRRSFGRHLAAQVSLRRFAARRLSSHVSRHRAYAGRHRRAGPPGRLA